MEEPDSGQVGLDSAGGFPGHLHVLHIADQMFATDVGQLLQAVVLGQIPAEPFHGLVVSVLGPEASLPIMPGQLVQLVHKGPVNALILDIGFHMKNSLLFSKLSSDGRSPPLGRSVHFRLISTETDILNEPKPLKQKT